MILFLGYCVAQALYALGLVAFYGVARGTLYGADARAAVLTALLGLDGALTLAFTGAMLRRQVVSLRTGVGTIDRLKLAKGKPIAGGTPVPLPHVFGRTRALWCLPVDPDFPADVEETVLGFRARRARDARDARGGACDAATAETPLFAEELKEGRGY